MQGGSGLRRVVRAVRSFQEKDSSSSGPFQNGLGTERQRYRLFFGGVIRTGQRRFG
jgi:hypothetical protein